MRSLLFLEAIKKFEKIKRFYLRDFFVTYPRV